MSETIVKPPMTASARFMRYWLPVAVMLTLMFLFSTDLFSGETTGRAIAWFFSFFWQDDGAPDIKETDFAIRKLAHFAEYAVLAFLLFRAFRADNQKRWRWRWALAAFAVVVVWSWLDEWHQTFTHTRVGSIYDSMIDSAGGFFALLIIFLVHYFKKRRGRSIY